MIIEKEFWIEYVATRDTASQNVLFYQYQEWTKWVAYSLYNKVSIEGVELEDFEQYAYEGLLKAISCFDITQDVKFETFAEYRIKGSILNHLPKVSESSAFYHKKKDLISKEYLNDTNKEPISCLINIVQDLSLEYFLNDEESGHNRYQGDFYSSPEIDTISSRIDETIVKLKDPKQGIITSYYKKGWSLSFIADLLELTKGRVSQLHTQAIIDIKKMLGFLG